jgi:hypothetical protein
MNTSDLIAIAGIGLPTVGGIIAWLWRHSTRLTASEIRIEGLTANAEADRRRSDAVFQDIRATLVRIEEKLDRKQDRP